MKGQANKTARADIEKRKAQRLQVKNLYVHPNEFNWAAEFNDGSVVYSDTDDTTPEGIESLDATPEQKKALIDSDAAGWGMAPMPKAMVEECTKRGIDPISDEDYASFLQNYK
jgi:hypothetical protein